MLEYPLKGDYMKNLKVYNKIFSLILVGTIFCGSLTGCGVKAKEVENQEFPEYNYLME
jgi:hypothetical protein